MVAEPIEGEVVAERSLAVVERPTVAPQAHVLSGVGAIAVLDDDEFERNLALIRKGVARAKRMQEALLDEGTDYGAVKGVKRPFLHKPGAEKFEKAYGLATRFTVERLVGDGITAPPLAFIANAYIHLGTFDGPVVAEGVGEANSWETKYRYRQGERLCPNCEQPAIRRGQKRDRSGDEWYCHRKANGCGKTFDIGDPAIVGQDTGKVDNPDPWDLANTLAKMATKRAHVDGILRATGTSGLFTQDDDAPGLSDRPATPAADPETGEVQRGPTTTPDSGLIGKAESSGQDDFEIRQTPTGWALPFRLKEGRASFKVRAEDALAQWIAEHRAEIEGQRVTAWGAWEDKSFVKNNDEGPQTIRYRVLRLERIETPAGAFPSPEPAETGDPLADLPAGWQ